MGIFGGYSREEIVKLEYLTTPQVMNFLGVNRSRVTALAKRDNWQFMEVPSRRNIKPKKYLVNDVEVTKQRLIAWRMKHKR